MAASVQVPCLSTVVASNAVLSSATAIRRWKALHIVMSQLLYCHLLQPEAARYPTDLQQDALPLIGKLTFHEGFRKPMQQVRLVAVQTLSCQPAAVLRDHSVLPLIKQGGMRHMLMRIVAEFRSLEGQWCAATWTWHKSCRARPTSTV